MLSCIGVRYLLIFCMTHERTELEEEKVIKAFWPSFKRVILYAVKDVGFGMQLGWEESQKMVMAKAEAWKVA